ncbi:hypothetical protein LINPERPRIM_LOCUS10942 [Linum perenne]
MRRPPLFSFPLNLQILHLLLFHFSHNFLLSFLSSSIFLFSHPKKETKKQIKHLHPLPHGAAAVHSCRRCRRSISLPPPTPIRLPATAVPSRCHHAVPSPLIHLVFVAASSPPLLQSLPSNRDRH